MRRSDPDLRIASTAILVCDPPENCDGRRDYQIGLKAAERDRLPANQRAQDIPKNKALLFPPVSPLGYWETGSPA